ncbi:MAG: DUF4249 domain-containing protein [Bacteroidota bacterium]|nr:DUF4249 domain-containing protein [Bacteroidota bacterium]
MKVLRKIALLFVAMTLLTACEDVVELDLPDSEPRILINGLITDSIGGYVDIMITAPYFSNQPVPRIDGATVELFEDGTFMTQLTQSDTVAGRYRTTQNGQIGKYYHIRVSINSGQFAGTTWESDPEELRRPADLDSAYQKFIEGDAFTDEGYYPFYAFTDPSGKGDCYRVRVWRNDSLFNKPGDIAVFDDELVDGFSFNEDSPFGGIQLDGTPGMSGNTYQVEHSGITRTFYNYLLLLRQQQVQVGSTFDPPPAPIIGNIHDANAPEQYGYGFFATYSPRIRRFTMDF